jgi:ferredoxin
MDEGEAADPHRPKVKRARVNVELCLGGGACVPRCGHAALKLELRPARVGTPVDSAHRIVRNAIGRLEILFGRWKSPCHAFLRAKQSHFPTRLDSRARL